MPVKKDNWKKAELYVSIGESSKDPAVGSRFPDCVTVFTQSSNSAELCKINPKFVIEGESDISKNITARNSHFINKAIMLACFASWPILQNRVPDSGGLTS